MSFVLIFAFAPIAALHVLWMCFAVIVGITLIARLRTPWMLGIAIAMSCLPLLWQRVVSLDAPLLVTLGITFATLRASAIIFDVYSRRAEVSLAQVGVHMFFLPLYTVGPLESVKKFSADNFQSSPRVEDFTRGFVLICLGLFKSVFIADELIRGLLETHYPLAGRDFSVQSSMETLLFVSLSFSYTYVNFTGFVDIARGASRLLGFDVMENFNYPVFARNLQEFWKRWHMSLGNWITGYLYFPIVVKLQSRFAPYVATFCAFTLIGWWHDSSINYLLWGVFHGLGLCAVMLWSRIMQRHLGAFYKRLKSSRLYLTVSWFATLVYVAWVQTFANQATFAESMAMTQALIGL